MIQERIKLITKQKSDLLFATVNLVLIYLAFILNNFNAEIHLEILYHEILLYSELPCFRISRTNLLSSLMAQKHSQIQEIEL